MGFPLGKEEVNVDGEGEEEVVGLDFMADEQTVGLLLANNADCRMGISLARRERLSPRFQRWGSCIVKSRLSPRTRRNVKE